MWKEKLETIKKEMELYQEKTNFGIGDEKILVRFQREVRKEFGYELPIDYLDFFRYINGFEYNGFEYNGFEYNGFVLYQIDEHLIKDTPIHQHVDGFIDTNQIWYETEANKEYIFIGDSNISFGVYSFREKMYYELDKPVTDNIINKFENINELLEQFFF